MTNILLLPFVYFEATTFTNGEWDDQIVFMNTNAPVDLTGIAFVCAWRRQADAPSSQARRLIASTDNGLIVNGGPSGILSFAAPVGAMGGVLPDTYLADIVATGDGHVRNLSGSTPSLITHKLGIS